ncbi:cardiomyopathy-associated protein 5 [Bombina bombina]|uniref:cardiomyopathy-associated protein 5 n=1 Tax=Bombina bombina TaxID=8345 RepID=UPI00235A9F00|nr:cardiomyopathy-associated protein 5 [Bombina bombina]
MDSFIRKMDTVCPSDCDRASEISFCLEDEVPVETVLNAEETEELTQSLKEIVETEEVKPKLQCLMSNPSFSMVTVQCEDSGIHWETSSSRCSTPWASEASTTSDVFSLESSSASSLPGKVIFIMDDGKLRHKKVRGLSSSELSRHSSRLKRNVDHQKQKSGENMDETFKQALEKAKGHSFSQRGRTAIGSCQEGPQELRANSLLHSKSIINSETAPRIEKTESEKAETLNRMPKQVAVPSICVNSDIESTKLFNFPATNDIDSPNNLEQNGFSNLGQTNSLNNAHVEKVVENSVLAKEQETLALLETEQSNPDLSNQIEFQPNIPQTTNTIPEKIDNLLTETLVKEHIEIYNSNIEKTADQPVLYYTQNEPKSPRPMLDKVKSDSFPEKESQKIEQAESQANDTIKQSNMQTINEINESILQSPVVNIEEIKRNTGNSVIDKSNIKEVLSEEQLDQEKPQADIVPREMDSAKTFTYFSENQTYLPDERNHDVETGLRHTDTHYGTKDPPDNESNVISPVSDGSEIINIVAPQYISAVNKDAKSQNQDKLESLNAKETPEENSTDINNIPTFNIKGEAKPLDENMSENQFMKKVDLENVILVNPSKNTTDIDYFEKFTLIDDKVPIEPKFKASNEGQKFPDANGIQCEDHKVAVEEVDYLLENVDESFYGISSEEWLITSQDNSFGIEESSKHIEGEARVQDNDLKAIGISLFNEEEGVLAKSYFFPASYKMLNPELLEEPPALAFLYTDLYEQAKGKTKTDENRQSDEESTSSAKSFHSRISDDDGTGIYFEKYNLKDEIPFNEAKSTDRSSYVGRKEVSSETEDLLSKNKILSYIDGCSSEPLGLRKMQIEREGDSNHIVKQRVIEEEKVESFEVLLPCDEKEKVIVGQDQISDKLQVPDLNVTSCKSEIERDQENEQINQKESTPKESEKVTDLIKSSAEHSETQIKSILKDKQIDEKELALSLDYVVISEDDLQGAISHEEIAIEDQESLEHDSDGGFDLFIEAEQEALQDHEESGFEIIEHLKSPSELSETSETEEKKQQIDTYCYTCKIPIVAIDKIFGDHKNHDVTTLDNAVNEMRDNLEDLLEKLQERSLKTEDFVSRVESLFNEVEKNCTEAEKRLLDQNEKMAEKVLAHHNAKKEGFEEVKKMKMDYLYDQMVSFQQKVDSAKEILEMAVKEMEEQNPAAFLSSHGEINNRLLSAMEGSLSLQKMPSAFSLFEQYAGSSSKGDQNMQKHIPVPHTPKLKRQEPNSATGNSIAVYWTMNEEDIIDCFQIYCMEEPQGKRDENELLEEYRVTVKESFCILEDLEPDKCYSVWVMAVNSTGCSLPTDKSAFRTAPSTPVIKAEECTVCWNTAIIRWNSEHPKSTESFTLEWCRQYPSEGEGLRSVSGIKDQQLKVTLLPNENYFFYVRAANTFGTSEQSEAALISTKGTRFHLLRDTAHPAMEISSDGNIIKIAEHTEITGIPLVLGELLPACGQHYWEMMVNESKAFSIGATFQPSLEEQPFVQDSTSWCMQCCCTPSSFSYKFLHNEVLCEVLLAEPLVQVGILLDYKSGRLSFFNAQKRHLLFAFRHKFTEAAHPTIALEASGQLYLHTGIELPQFAKRS